MEFARERHPKDRTNCSVFGCNSIGIRNRNLSFHKFPEPNKCKTQLMNRFGIVEMVDVHKAWILRLKFIKEVTKGMRVCSLHFTSSDYFPNRDETAFRKLKKNSVPSVNLPTGSHKIKPPVRRISKRQTPNHEKSLAIQSTTQPSNSRRKHEMQVDINQCEQLYLIEQLNTEDQYERRFREDSLHIGQLKRTFLGIEELSAPESLYQLQHNTECKSVQTQTNESGGCSEDVQSTDCKNIQTQTDESAGTACNCQNV